VRVVGKLVSINRYPVKSMQGESLPGAQVGPLGIANDRSWAVRDVATDRVLSAKREGRLLLAAARTDAGGVRVTLPGGPTRAADDPEVSRELSEWLGRQVRLAHAPPRCPITSPPTTRPPTAFSSQRPPTRVRRPPPPTVAPLPRPSSRPAK